MRPIKFRAWLKKRKVMGKVLTIHLNEKPIILAMKDGGVGGITWFDLNNENAVVMQSTGLADKNGKEIFEGDIVENTTQTVYLGHKFEVTWNENYAVYQLMNNGLGSNIPLVQDSMSYEVIGNIYENKELLNEL